MGQVQVRMEIYVYSDFVSSIYTFTLLFYSRGMNAIHAFSFFFMGEQCRFATIIHGLWDDGRVRE